VRGRSGERASRRNGRSSFVIPRVLSSAQPFPCLIAHTIHRLRYRPRRQQTELEQARLDIMRFCFRLDALVLALTCLHNILCGVRDHLRFASTSAL